MALKNWKQKKSERYDYAEIVQFNKIKGYGKVTISPYEYSPINKFQVLIDRGEANTLTHKFFKTKSQALAYARSYMRKY